MIAVAGEALVDLVVRPSGEIQAVPGGGCFNVARALARLGQPVSFVGALSSDRFGIQLRQALEEEGVSLEWATDTELPTTLALAQLDEHANASYSFYFEGTSVPQTIVPPFSKPPEVLCVGGLGLALEPMATLVEQAVARSLACTLIFADINWRPAAVADPSRYRARLERVCAAANVVKVSSEDLEHWGITGHQLLEMGTDLVLYTDGPHPVRALHREWEIKQPAVEAVEVIDTVGAGDSFCAGWLAAWLRARNSIEQLADREAVGCAVALATQVAALTCQRAGADPPHADQLAGYQ